METFQKRLEGLLDNSDHLEIHFVVNDGNHFIVCTYTQNTQDSNCKYYLPVENLSFDDALKFIIAFIEEKKNGTPTSQGNQS